MLQRDILEKQTSLPRSGVEGKAIFVCEHSADVVEEDAYSVSHENLTSVHIKLNRNRRAEGTDCVCAKYFSERSVFATFSGFLADR